MNDHEDFGRYISEHTILGYNSAAGLYEFCKALGLSKEEVVDQYGDPESLRVLAQAKICWKEDIIEKS
jgi:hypothetical protein